ncbi:hypothetical protein [Hyphomicrobium sp. D-2]|uniref:hypothetical protein n=1 Tax=Hyphomicrobium sp. D-2 TaxID=3041621 RepID=UPI0024551315|nr:hypothetical protein [Hyphomicrobium sp. D-2]MDH4980954.1 hypothetical protein [Hyphomicrobium sp. D-2]
MQHRPTHKGNGHDPKEAMAVVLALVATFFGGPELYHFTIGTVIAFAESRYGADLAPVAVIGWALIVAAFSFYAARITFDIALVSAIMAVAMRLF